MKSNEILVFTEVSFLVLLIFLYALKGFLIYIMYIIYILVLLQMDPLVFTEMMVFPLGTNILALKWTD